MDRRWGAAWLSIVFFWLAVAGFTNAVVWWVLPEQGVLQLSPYAQLLFRPLRSVGMSVLSLCYGVTAAATAIALWRMRRWMRSAIASWILVVLASITFVSLNWPIAALAWPILLAALIITSAVLWAIWRYVSYLHQHAQ